MYRFALLLLAAVSLSARADSYDRCLLDALKHAAEATTAAQIRLECDKRRAAGETAAAQSESTPGPADSSSAIVQRQAIEKATADRPFVLTPHRPNYFLPITYNSRPNQAPFTGTGETIQKLEFKFQLSVKMKVWNNMFGDNGDLYLAYTNTSWWQAYDRSSSSPFRETDHEPELFVDFDTDWHFGDVHIRQFRIGLDHQSNGRGGSLSRSWNRVEAQFAGQLGDFYFMLRPWWRIPENKKSSPSDSTGDDNPDIEKYLGYGEFYLLYKWHRQNFAVMLRDNLRHDNKGAIQIDWSFPISERIRGYVQYFNGYGESLIDYNASVNRIGIGIMLTDWL